MTATVSPLFIACVAAVPLLLALLVQFLHLRAQPGDTGRWLVRHAALFVAGTLPLYGLMLCITGLTGSIVLGCCVTAVLSGVLAYANYLMLVYREQPLLPRDFIMALNLGKLLGMLSPVIIVVVLAGLAVFAALAALLYRALPAPAFAAATRFSMALGGGAVLTGFCLAGRNGNSARLLLLLCGADFARHGSNTWANFQENGYLAAFFSLCARPLMDAPADYGKKAVEDTARVYATRPPLEAARRRPHILYIMSEAFSDPTRLGLRFSEDPIARLRALAERFPSGLLAAPGYGGGTAHCEFEALTGFSTALTGGVSPFENNVNRRQGFPALPRRLLQEGYDTIALHPYKRGMYARTEAYPAMGISRFIDVSGMRHTKTPDASPYVSDAEAYSEALDLLRASEKPLFLHLVTMQNHGDYRKHGRFRNTITAEGPLRDQELCMLETYVQGLRYTDEATADLFTQLSSLEDEVIVVFWGDHLPGVYPPGFIADFPLRRYETPFLIWANYPLPAVRYGTRSPMALPVLLAELAGLAPTPFDALHRALAEELSAVHERFVLDASGTLLDAAHLNPRASALLAEYRLIQYDAMLGQKHAGAAGFFGKTEA